MTTSSGLEILTTELICQSLKLRCW